MAGAPCSQVGRVSPEARIALRGLSGGSAVSVGLEALAAAYGSEGRQALGDIGGAGNGDSENGGER